MQTVVINNQKGGVGKTMLAVHAAWRFAELGKRVLFVDLDPQANASFTLSAEHRLGASYALFTDTPPSPSPSRGGIALLAADRQLDRVEARMTEAVQAFGRSFADLTPFFDLAVVDTPPTWSGRNYAALMVATTLIAPVDLETYALQGVQQLVAQKAAVEKGARRGRPIDLLGLLPSRFQSNSPRQRANLEALLRHRNAGMLFPNHGLLTQRQGYAEAVDVKQPVWRIKKSAASLAGREILSVIETVTARLDALKAAADV